MEFIYKAAPLGDIISDFDEKNGVVKGYGSYFDNKDSDQDIIRKGAYQKTIQENGSRVFFESVIEKNVEPSTNVMKKVYDGYNLQWKITYRKQVAAVKEYIDNETFLLTYGDGLSNVNVNELIKFHHKSKKLITLNKLLRNY